MTTKELSQLYWLNQEIRQDRARLQKLETEIQNLTPSYEAVTARRQSGKSKAEKLAVLICEQKRLIEIRLEKLCREQNKLQHFIDTIDSSLIRQIFQFRYGLGCTWRQVADKIGTCDESTLRRLHKKYLQMPVNSAYF